MQLQTHIINKIMDQNIYKNISIKREDENYIIEWTKQKTLDFIQDYRLCRVLWERSRTMYNRTDRLKAVMELSQKYQCSTECIRNKIKSLRSSFHRERSKYLHRKEGNNPYEPLWFAFEPMKFILDGQVARKTVPAPVVGNNDSLSNNFINYDYLELQSGNNCNSITQQDNMKNCYNNKLHGEVVATDSHSNHKRFKPNTSSYDNDELQHLPPQFINNNNYLSNRDEFTVFGEHVALTLKRLKSDNSRIVAKHLISNILYEAEMRTFDKGPVPVASTDVADE